MFISKDLDSGVVPPHEIRDDKLVLDLRPGQKIADLLVRDAPASFTVTLLVDRNGRRLVADQGLVVTDGMGNSSVVALSQESQERLSAEITSQDGCVRISNRYPYGRDGLDRLLCDTASAGRGQWKFLSRDYRSVPMFELGKKEQGRKVHYFIAGEDCWETGGCWVGDGIVRELCGNAALADSLAGKSCVRVVPLVSPYSATRDAPSYTTFEGEKIYGAATWGDAEPPPEYALLREMVYADIRDGDLGFLLTIHSWQGAHGHNGLETIQSSGENHLSHDRISWTQDFMERISENVPAVKIAFPETIWHTGLARDYLLGEHNTVTFRIEITTVDFGPKDFRKTGTVFLQNLDRMSDFSMICP